MPFGLSKAAILGAAGGGGASLTLSGGTDFTYDGVDYHKFTCLLYTSDAADE